MLELTRTGRFPFLTAVTTPHAELGLGDPRLTGDHLLDAMMAHPILINRPLVITERGTRRSRPSEVVLDILPMKKVNALIGNLRHVTEN